MAGSNPNPTEEFNNATRHEHGLCRLEDLPTYKCNGCKEFGDNVGYRCKFQNPSSPSCDNFTLHEACATLPDDYQALPARLFKFRPRTKLRHHCDACQDVVKGFFFETERHVKLHPLCMVLPRTLMYSRHADHELVMNDLELHEYTCNACNKQIDSGGWRYQCAQYKVDLSCAKIDIHRLRGVTRVALINRNRRFMSKLKKPGKWITKTLLPVVVQVGIAAATGEFMDRTRNPDGSDHNGNRNPDDFSYG